MSTPPRSSLGGDPSDRGVAMIALLVGMSVMGVMLSVALPAWQTAARREKEAELVFRGEQYARAVAAFQRRYGNTFPPTVDVLVEERFLRKKYLDPITGEEFELISPTSAIAGGLTTPAALTGGRGGAAGAQTSSGGGSSTAGRGSSSTTMSSITTSSSLAVAARGGGSPQTSGGARAGGRGASQATWQIAGGATSGIMGVRSKSKEKSFRVYNGADSYDQWLFLATQATTAVSAPAGGAAGARDGRGEGRGQPARGGRGLSTGSSINTGRGQPAGTRGRGGAAPAQRGGAPSSGTFGGGGNPGSRGGRGF